MRARHRTPTLFTLSMLDVFCCALGCVILLWLWNERMAKARAKSAGETRQQLEYTRNELADARKFIDSMTRDLTAARTAIGNLTGERDQTRKDLAAAQAAIASLTGERDLARKDLAATRKDLADRMAELTRTRTESAQLADSLRNADNRAKDLADQLAKAKATSADLSRQLSTKSEEHRKAEAVVADLLRKKAELDKAAADLRASLTKLEKDDTALKTQAENARKRVAELELLTREKDTQLTLAAAKAKETADRLNDLDGQLRLARTKLESSAGMQASLDDQAKRLAVADSRIKDLEKFLNTRKSIMIDMQGKLDDLESERKSLSESLTKLKLAADNRFAGIQLTGRRVIFVVDMSGSMKMTDEVNAAPDKWNTVVSTVVKVMKSLPDLEKYQVVLFGEGISFPIGDGSNWLDYNAATSPDWVKSVLSKVEPRGNTNMYAAFEAAFRFRSRGLDTIYLLSDGLPNTGPGLSPQDQTRNLKETEKGELLGKYIRNTVRQTWNRPASGMPRVRINSIGFFYESPDVGAFLWALSRESDGSFVGMSQP